jgi:hypothetical protein
LPPPDWRQSCKKATYLPAIMPQMIWRKVVFRSGFSGPGAAGSEKAGFVAPAQSFDPCGREMITGRKGWQRLAGPPGRDYCNDDRR